MENKMKTLIVYTILPEEILKYKESISVSIANIQANLKHDIFHLFVIQGDAKNIPKEWSLKNSKIMFIENKGVSFSRNVGIIYALAEKFDYVLFHDSSLMMSAGFCSFLSLSIKNESNILSGEINWSKPSDFSNSNVFDSVTSIKPEIMKRPYLGTYLIPLSLIGSLRFNEKIGPGEKTILKCGEDVQFLAKLFIQNNIQNLMHSSSAYVFHPARSGDNSKELLYARGQAALYRYLLAEKIFHFGVLKYFLYFCLNGVLKVFLFQKKSLSILKKRVAGFISSDYLLFKGDTL